MLTQTEIRTQLRDRNLAAVARRINVSRAWLSKIRSGEEMSDTMQKLLSYYLTGGDNDKPV